MLEKERLDFVCEQNLHKFEQLKDSSNIAIGVLMAQQAQLQKQINSYANDVSRYDKYIETLNKLKETKNEKYYYDWLDLCSTSFNDTQVNMNDDIVIAYISNRLGIQYAQGLMEKLK